MSGNFYDGLADRRCYVFPAATVSGAAVVGRFQGPPGKIGRVRGIGYAITTDVTVAAANITVGINGAVAPATVQIPVAAVGVCGEMSAANLAAAGAAEVAGTNDVELHADTTIEVASDGGATAGAADLVVTVDWF